MNQNAPDQLSPVIQPPSGTPPLFGRQMIGLVFFAITYWITVRLGFLVVAQPEGVASIWPVSGLALAILLLNPKHQWAKLLTVIFVTNAIGNWSGGNSLLISLGFALANTLEPALAAWVLTYFFKSKITFERTTEVCALLFVATLINSITAFLGATVSMLAFHGSFMDGWLIWWAADGLGIILVTPVIVSWAANKSVFPLAPSRQIMEMALLVLILAIFTWLLFGSFTVAEEPLLRNYMFFPLLIWLAFRFTSRGVETTLLLVSVIAIWGTLQGYGIFSFANQTRTEHLVSLQIFLIVLDFSGLLLSAMVAERKLVEMELQAALIREQQLARTDALTGINNHGSLFELARHAFDVAMRYQQPLAMVMFDIDDFKKINDTFGHSVGDQVLKQITQIVCAELRSSDAIGRYGGDEFNILLPQTSAEEALALAERIHAGIAALRLDIDKGPLTVTISLGIAQTLHGVPEPGVASPPDTVGNLFLRADRALYAAKQAGKNRSVIFESRQQ